MGDGNMREIELFKINNRQKEIFDSEYVNHPEENLLGKCIKVAPILPLIKEID